MTGATGFIGRNLLSRLTADGTRAAITAVTRRTPPESPAGVSWIHADVSETTWTARLPDVAFDIVIHLAQSEHYRGFPARAPDIVNLNVNATVALAEWASRHEVRQFVFASTGSVYGSSDRIHREDDECRPDTMYAASKLAAEMLLKPFSAMMDVLALRLFGVYGPGQANAILPGVIKRFDTGEEITLAGNAGVRFNPIFVDDCSALFDSIVTRTLKGFQLLNVCGSEVVDLRDVVKILEAATGKKAHVRVTEDAPILLVGCTDRLVEMCGHRSTVSFSEGLAITYRHSHGAGTL